MFRFFAVRQFDWVLAASAAMLVALGFAAIYSIDLSRGDGTFGFLRVQSIALVIGLGLFLFCATRHLQVYRLAAPYLYLLAVGLLTSVLFFGSTIRGTKGWFRIAGFSFQPSEVAKVALAFALAWLISRFGRRFDSLSYLVSTGLATALLGGLILLQPDLGSALVLFSLWGLLLLASRTRPLYLISLFLSGVLVFAFAWIFLFHPYQKDRVKNFLNPARDPLGSGYNVTQSIIAIGSGQIFGRGLGYGSQSQLHFLPEAQTDFIFSVIGEELGFVGVFLLLFLYFVLLSRLIRIATMSRSEFGAYLVFGIGGIFLVQLLYNIGGAVGIVPITGVTLPFVSYGGSSLIVNLALVGVAEGVAYTTTTEVSYTAM